MVTELAVGLEFLYRCCFFFYEKELAEGLNNVFVRRALNRSKDQEVGQE